MRYKDCGGRCAESAGFFKCEKRAQHADELLNGESFYTLNEAQIQIERWRRHYNEDRPHSAIGYNVPIAMHYPDGVTSPSS